MDPRDEQYLSPFPSIPLIEVGKSGSAAVAEAQPERMIRLIENATTYYGDLTIGIADQMSEYWLSRNKNPYKEEMDAIASYISRSGIYMLNMSFEWSCTTGVGPDPEYDGNRLLRTLDWPLAGIGRDVVVARFQGDEGTYDSITWPGFTGVLTAIAPGRFSAAINQPPIRRWSPSSRLDWGINRARMWREDSLPPVHLLRQVFDQCRNYIEAREILCNTPLAMPALITLSGLDADQACLIERTEDEVCVHNGSGALANHWLQLKIPGRSRGGDSQSRFAQMQAILPNCPNDFAWVREPILNQTTRLSMVANAKTGHLKVLGWEQDKSGLAAPATLVFDEIASNMPGQFRIP